MTINKNKLNQDLKFGFDSEDTSRPFLNRFFKCELYNTRTDDNDKYNKFDYRGEVKDNNLPEWYLKKMYPTKIKVELKTRKCKFGQYPDLQFELGKIKEAQQFLRDHPTGKCYFVWRCIYDGWDEKGFVYWEYNKDEYFTGWGGRNDRGKDEYKTLCKIKNKYIKRMFL